MKKIVLLSNVNVNNVNLNNNIQQPHNEQPEWNNAPFDFIR